MSGLWNDVIWPRKRRSVRREMKEHQTLDYDEEGSKKGSVLKRDDVSLGVLLLSQVATNVADNGEKAILPFKKRKHFVYIDGDGKDNGGEEKGYEEVEREVIEECIEGDEDKEDIEGVDEQNREEEVQIDNLIREEEEEVTSVLQISDFLDAFLISKKSTTIGKKYRWNEKEECEIDMETIKTIPSSIACEEEKEKIEKKRAIVVKYSRITTRSNRKGEVEDGSRKQPPGEDLYTIVNKRCDRKDKEREKTQDEAVKDTKFRRRKKRKYRTFESLYRSTTQVMTIITCY